MPRGRPRKKPVTKPDNQTDTDKTLFRLEETADYFGVSERTILLWLEHGHLQSKKVDGIPFITWESIMNCKFRNQFVTLPNKEYLRPDEIAKYFSLSVKTIYGWIETGKLDGVKVGPHDIVRVKRETVESMIRPTIQ